MAEKRNNIHLYRIELAQCKVAEALRGYIRSQVTDWQRVPWLALQANNRTSYSSSLEIACRYGIYPLSFAGNGPLGLFVDCADGMIVTGEGRGKPNAQRVVRLLDHLCYCDAREIVAKLREDAAKEHSNRCWHEENKRREQLARQLGLTEIYTKEQRNRVVKRWAA